MMAILLFGATGMLGQAIGAEATRRGSRVIGASRHGPDIAVDLTKAASVRRALDDACADLVVNAAAMTVIDECESDPGLAYAVNARAVAVMSAHCRSSGAAFIHVSTDHFFSGDRDRRHDEHAPVRLVNEYARTKFAGEAFARTYPDSLVLRTNVTGLRDWMGRPTFAEWIFDALRLRSPLVLCDSQTLEYDNLLASDLRYPDRTGETYAITYNPNQRWYYFPKMQPDEAVLIRCFDSAREGPARFSAHGAFDDPNTPDNAPPRESIEVRTLVFF